MSIKVYVCDPQPIVGEGVRGILANHEELEFAGACTTQAECLEKIRALIPGVVLLDGAFGLRNNSQFLNDLKAAAPTYAVLWVQDYSETDCFRALQIGARGLVRKNVSIKDLIECLITVGTGRIWFEDAAFDPRSQSSAPQPVFRFTPREQQIVDYVCRGLKNREIAAELGITPGTVKVHLMHIFGKDRSEGPF